MSVGPHRKLIGAVTKRIILEMRKWIWGSLWFLMKTAAMWGPGKRTLGREMCVLSLLCG